MFALRFNQKTIHGMFVAACLALLSGCVPEPSVPTPPPDVPANLVATSGNATVTLTWAASSGATSYSVKRAITSGGPYTQVATPTTAGYTDSAVTNGTAYYYVVSAVGPSGASADSGQVSATPAVPALPTPPAGLTPTVGNAQVTLNWSVSAGATSYRVKRATTTGGPYVQIAAPTPNTYIDTTLTNGTTYYYVVSAVNSVGESANSAQVSATPSPPPPTVFGTWTNVTPAGVDLTVGTGCGNFGARTVQADPMHPSDLYLQFNCQGIWKSTNYGATWTGPINTGTNAAAVGDCGGGITISPTSTANVPVIYQACIRGAGLGFWRSVDAGVNWTRYVIAPSGGRQDFNPPVVDPYDQNHLLMAGHEIDYVVESFDGGQNWSNVPMASGMLQNGRTAFIFFVNTGNATTTRGTWLWLGEQNGGGVGTWRTSNGGANWAKVDANEHLLGGSQIYQPDNSGVVYMAGAYSALGWGVLRSSDYGQTWIHVGTAGTENIVFGTPKNVYSLGIGPRFQVAAQPGTGTWVSPANLAGLTQDAIQVSVVNNGTNNIVVGAMGNGGVWRYVEP